MTVLMASMLTFTSIGDEKLRQLLESDYRELQACIASQSWKATVVLSGSIVEAVLTDYLLSEPTFPSDPLTMQLSDLINASLSLGGIDQRAADLSAVIRSYRNLIHPGRVARLGETVDEDSASIAAHVVSIIVRQVSDKRIQVHGYSAVQLVDKLVSDPSATAIAKHLISDLPKKELESLLLKEIPERYFAIDQGTLGDDDEPLTLVRLNDLFYLAYSVAEVDTQSLAAKRFVSVLKEESRWQVEMFEDNFFTVDYFNHLDEPDRQLVKDHLFAGIDGKFIAISRQRQLKRVSRFVNESEIMKLFDPFFRTVGYSRADSWSDSAADWIADEYFINLPTELQSVLLSRTDDWITHARENEQPQPLERFSALKEKMEAWEPF